MNPDLVLAEPDRCIYCGDEDHGDHVCYESDPYLRLVTADIGAYLAVDPCNCEGRCLCDD